MMKHVVKTFRQFHVFVFDPMPENENAESAESFIKFIPTISVILTDWILMLRHLQSTLLDSRISFSHFSPFNFCCFNFEMKDRGGGSFFKIKTDPNQAIKQACVLKQL